MNRHTTDQIPQHLMPIAQRLIDTPSEAMRDPEVKRAIESNPPLRTLAQSMVDLGPVLTSAGHERDAALLGALQRRARMAAEQSAAPSRGWLGGLLHSRMRLAVVGGLAMVMLAIIAATQLISPPIGHLEFSSDDVLISGVPVSHTSHPSIGPDDIVQVRSGSGLIRLSNGSAIAASEGARFQVISAEEIRVDEGRVYFDAASADPMRVVFRGGSITSGRAVFELDLTGDWPEIDVNGGRAEVQCKCRLTRLGAGDRLLLECDTGHRSFEIPNPEELPPWMTTLLASAEGESIDVEGIFVPETCFLSPELYFSGAYEH